jgi:hypothetical protein
VPSRVFVAVVLSLTGPAALAACGDDDGGASAFCEQFQAGPETGETEVETLDRLLDVAPAGVAPNLAILRNDAAERTEDGPAPAGSDHEAFAPGTDSELQEVRLRVFTFVATECDAGAGG